MEQDTLRALRALNDAVVEVIASASLLSDQQLQAISKTIFSVQHGRSAKITTFGGIERVYCAQNPVSGLIKIGYSRKVEDRLESLRVQEGLPFPLTVIRVALGNRATEKAILSKFELQRHHGEWFTPSAELISYMRSLPPVPFQTIRKRAIKVPSIVPLFNFEDHRKTQVTL